MADKPIGLGDARYINPVTGQPELASDNSFGKMPAIRQRVAFALGTALGSSTASPGLGVKRPDKMGDGFERQLEQRVRAALRQLTDVEKLITVLRVDVIRGTMRSQATVSFMENQTGTTGVVAIG